MPAPIAAPVPPPGGRLSAVRDAAQELRELGLRGVAFRTRWELSTRTGLVELLERAPPPVPHIEISTRPLPFGDGRDVAAALDGRIPAPALERLRRVADEATRGRILCFSRWIGDYGDPVDWHRNPVNGRRWEPRAHWSQALAGAGRIGDVKLTWEIGRFPHAYHMARAAALTPGEPAERARLAGALALQIERFLECNPRPLGVHWISGQELAFRVMAWLFALSVLGAEPALARLAPALAGAVREAAAHIEQHLDYARIAVYNNHLLSEAFGLLLAARALPGAPEAGRWREIGAGLLEQQAGAQIYEDGAYIQCSHTYHRVAMHIYLWAAALERRAAGAVPAAWTAAMERSLDFLHAQQSPVDGRLSNFGPNDGALPSVLTTCDYTDFRPLLQALSVMTRGERLYEPGPWDETAAWLAGPAALSAPLRPRARRSVSFGASGYHVLRGDDPASFAVLRCGTLRDRFSQIDMLSLDVFWRGHNVLVDAGSYLYNGPPRWHELFAGTSSHNTVEIDGRDQMLHYRRFKNIYGIRAELLGFQDHPAYALVEGEHHGYARHPGRCVHRRAVLFVKDDLWIVVDRIAGEGHHAARLHWLGGPFPHRHDRASGALELDTPAGPFSVTLIAASGAPLTSDVIAGGHEPPRGWLSRYYGEKVPAPSLAAVREAPLPMTLISVLCPGRPAIHVDHGRFDVACAAARVRFRIDDGRITAVDVLAPAPRAGVTPP
ncbi:MAG: alginate lyase family protein [Polyangiaceae bacterium]|nr:alginate lyase family protein [Polyangiaceae bacterium]